MCGRFLLISSPQAVRDLLKAVEEPDFPPRYNIAPSQPIMAVYMDGGVRHTKLMRWGLIPSWVKDPRNFALVFNARADSVLDKPSFKNAMKRRRCLIPSDGFYEWQAQGGAKRPFYIHPAEKGPIAFAGLWETWVGPNGEELDTACIITTEASGDLRAIHDRMPAVIQPDAFDMWLDCARVDAETAAALLAPPPRGFFDFHEISLKVNRAAVDGPELIRPVGDATVAGVADESPPAPPKPRRKKPEDDGQQSLF
jgi:putative SOS response-associated peptidase YedK